jgi:hypothetical protein
MVAHSVDLLARQQTIALQFVPPFIRKRRGV